LFFLSYNYIITHKIDNVKHKIKKIKIKIKIINSIMKYIDLFNSDFNQIEGFSRWLRFFHDIMNASLIIGVRNHVASL